MGNRYVLYSKAKEDLEIIFEYISLHLVNEEAALRLILKFENKFVELLSFPKAYPIIDHPRIETDKLRKCVVDNFFIFYLHNEEHHSIEIVRVVHVREDYLNFFK